MAKTISKSPPKISKPKPKTAKPANTKPQTTKKPTPVKTQAKTQTATKPDSTKTKQNSTSVSRTQDKTDISAEARSTEKTSERANTISNALADSLGMKQTETTAQNKDDTARTRNLDAPKSATAPERNDEATPINHDLLNFSAPSVKLGNDPQDPRRAANIEELERLGVPENSRNHFAGPAAAPVNGFRPDELNEDGTPRLGTTVNEVRPGLDTTSHRYVTVNALDTTDRALAERAFNGFNAPTHDALNGRPNPVDQTEGNVDPTAPLPLGLNGSDVPHVDIPLVGRLDVNDLGGHVSTHRGRTPEGNPWAINTTTPGRHPLRGHITRSLIEHDGNFFVRTEGVGSGPTFQMPGTEGNSTENPHPLDITRHASLLNLAGGAARDVVNSVVGPPTFHNLDQAANEWLRGQQP
jgi:hypothetical protein